MTTLELDIGVTADGVVVIAHDPYLNPAITRDADGQWLPGAKGPLIKSLTVAQLQAYELGRINPASDYAKTFSTQQPRDGTRMPTLAALFDRVKALGANGVRFNIETKIDPGKPDDTVSAEAMTRALLKVDPGRRHDGARHDPELRLAHPAADAAARAGDSDGLPHDPDRQHRQRRRRLLDRRLQARGPRRQRARSWSRPPAARCGRRTAAR